jgi:starch-binding outer membrane protein, SusD/RagB family
MKNRIKAPATAMFAVVALTGCDILDVSNPNNLVEASIRSEAAASAVVNGALSLVASSVSQSWQPYLVATDEMYWIGSRDAWLSVDQGFVDDATNEFIDGPFPALGQARWFSDEAIEILTEHVGTNPSTGNKTDLARANLFSGIIYMVIGETQDDFAFSDKTEDGPPVGPANMFQVLDGAITRLDAAITGFNGVGDSDRAMKAMSVRARAKQSRAIWDAINPSPSGSGFVNSASAGTDALAVIAAAGGVTADWSYNLTYSSGTVGNSMASWINDRKENQIDLSLVTVNAANDINGIAIKDPIDGVDDPAAIKWLNQWKGASGTSGSYLDKGGVYADLTLASTRMMHLIVAENALASGDNAGFTTHINHVRAMDGLTPFSGQVSNTVMMQHTRRVNVLFQGLRLGDMYRFKLTDSKWDANGAAMSRPGEMLPISIIELRSNCYLNGLGCK